MRIKGIISIKTVLVLSVHFYWLELLCSRESLTEANNTSGLGEPQSKQVDVVYHKLYVYL